MASDDKEDDKLLKRNKATINDYLKYSGMGFQMALIITVLSYGGLIFDNYLNTKPVFTVILSLCSVLLAMFVFVKSVIGQNSQENDSQNIENKS